MSSNHRRDQIKNIINNSRKPKKGQELAEELGVTRQIIVKDIAILRASGTNIIATPEGYLIPKHEQSSVERIIAVSHSRDEIEDELSVIIKYGGTIKDVTVEHPLYGEIKAMLMIKTLYDLESFNKKRKKFDAEPLLSLTRGIHLHTIEADSKENIESILKELEDKGYLIDNE